MRITKWFQPASPRGAEQTVLAEVSRFLGLVSDGCRQDKEEGVWKKINTGFLSYKPRKLLKRTRFKNLGWNEKALGATR